MLEKDPEKRLKVGQILNHPWFRYNHKDPNNPKQESFEVFNEKEKLNMIQKFIYQDSDDIQVTDQMAEEAAFDDKLDAADF